VQKQEHRTAVAGGEGVVIVGKRHSKELIVVELVENIVPPQHRVTQGGETGGVAVGGVRTQEDLCATPVSLCQRCQQSPFCVEDVDPLRDKANPQALRPCR
jgi:hypothetical protein